MAGFVACTLGIQEIIRLGSGTDANQTAVRFSSFFRLLFFLERKEEYGKAMIKIAGCMRDFREKKIPGIRDQIPLPETNAIRVFQARKDKREASEKLQIRSTGVGASHVGRVSCPALLACFTFAFARLKNVNK